VNTADRGNWHCEADQATRTADFVKDNFRVIVLLAILVTEIAWMIFV
jgi:hypothetical protein